MENAQAQDQKRCEKALRSHRNRHDQTQLGPQAPSPDQQVEGRQAAAPRHDYDGAGRREAGVDLHALSEELIRWPGLSAASPRTPATRRFSASPKAIAGVAAPS